MKISFLLLSAALIIFLIIIVALGYVKAPPDKAFIISGLKKEPKILIGPFRNPNPVFRETGSPVFRTDDSRY